MAAAAKARGDAPPVVASPGALAGVQQGLFRCVGGDPGEVRGGHEAPRGGIWAISLRRHKPSLGETLELRDALARSQGDGSFFALRTEPAVAA